VPRVSEESSCACSARAPPEFLNREVKRGQNIRHHAALSNLNSINSKRNGGSCTSRSAKCRFSLHQFLQTAAAAAGKKVLVAQDAAHSLTASMKKQNSANNTKTPATSLSSARFLLPLLRVSLSCAVQKACFGSRASFDLTWPAVCRFRRSEPSRVDEHRSGRRSFCGVCLCLRSSLVIRSRTEPPLNTAPLLCRRLPCL